MQLSETDEERRARFESLAQPLIEPLRRYLARRTDPETAQDVLSDTLLVCWRRLEQLPEDRPLPWAYGVARHALHNAERGERRQRRLAARVATVDPPAATIPGPDATIDSGGDPGGDPDVLEALAVLREEDAELLRLWAWEHLGPADLATVLDISPNAAGIRLHRARQKLREQLEARKIPRGAGHEES